MSYVFVYVYLNNEDYLICCSCSKVHVIVILQPNEMLQLLDILLKTDYCMTYPLSDKNCVILSILALFKHRTVETSNRITF